MLYMLERWRREWFCSRHVLLPSVRIRVVLLEACAAAVRSTFNPKDVVCGIGIDGMCYAAPCWTQRIARTSGCWGPKAARSMARAPREASEVYAGALKVY
jgi:hypothetical protein